MKVSGWARLWIVAATLGGCVTGPKTPEPIGADLVILGRIITSEPALIGISGDGRTVDIFADGQRRVFEVLGQPGVSVVGYDRGYCPEGDLGDKALLVFMQKNRVGNERSYFVRACPVVDAFTIDRLEYL